MKIALGADSSKKPPKRAGSTEAGSGGGCTYASKCLLMLYISAGQRINPESSQMSASAARNRPSHGHWSGLALA